jgi:hypothetical protein
VQLSGSTQTQLNISPSTRTAEYYRSLLSYGYFEVLKAFSHWLFQKPHLSCTTCASSASARLWAVSDLGLLLGSRYDLHNLIGIAKCDAFRVNIPRALDFSTLDGKPL